MKKENIIILKNGQEIMSVQGRGDVVCRRAKTENKILLFVNNEKDYIDQMGVLSAKYNA